MARWNLTLVHSCPTAWDYKFHKIKKRAYLLVTLKDNSVFAGSISSNSFASSQYAGRDFYLEECYQINKDGDWKKYNNDDGIYFNNDQIKTIQFFKERG